MTERKKIIPYLSLELVKKKKRNLGNGKQEQVTLMLETWTFPEDWREQNEAFAYTGSAAIQDGDSHKGNDYINAF